MLPYLRKILEKLPFIAQNRNNSNWKILGDKIYDTSENMTLCKQKISVK
jgi:hypothetical protein